MGEKTDFPPIVSEALKKGPQIHPDTFIAKGAMVMGDVRLSQGASIWYNCVVRGDINYISVGRNSNIQDGSILHVENERACIIGDNVTVGHHVNLHACTVEDGCLIGIGAIILSGAIIKKGSVIGAGAVVKEGQIVEENSLYVGIPAKKAKDLNPEVTAKNIQWSEKYNQLAKSHAKSGFGTTPLME